MIILSVGHFIDFMEHFECEDGPNLFFSLHDLFVPTFPYKVVGVTSSEWTDRFHDPHVQENYLETTFI